MDPLKILLWLLVVAVGGYITFNILAAIIVGIATIFLARK